MLRPLQWPDLLQSGPLKDCLQKDVFQTVCSRKRYTLDFRSCAGGASS